MINNFSTGVNTSSEKGLSSGQGFGEAQVFNIDYDKLIKNRQDVEEKAKKEDASAYGVLGSVEKLRGALPGQAEYLNKQKEQYREEFKQAVLRGEHRDPAKMAQWINRGEVLAAAYADSNESLKSYLKMQEQIAKDPNSYGEEARKAMQEIIDPKTYTSIGDNLPAMMAETFNRLNGIKKIEPPKELPNFLETGSIKSMKLPIVEDQKGYQGKVQRIDEDTLHKNAVETFNKALTPEERNIGIIQFGSEEGAINAIETKLRSQVGTLGLTPPKTPPQAKGSGSNQSAKSFFNMVTVSDSTDGKIKGIKRFSINPKRKMDIVGSVSERALSSFDPTKDKGKTQDEIKKSERFYEYTIEGIIKQPNGKWMAEIKYKKGDNIQRDLINLEESKAYGITTDLSGLVGRPVQEWSDLWQELYDEGKTAKGESTESKSTKPERLPGETTDAYIKRVANQPK